MSAATKIYTQRQTRIKSYNHSQAATSKPSQPPSNHLPEHDHPFNAGKPNTKPPAQKDSSTQKPSSQATKPQVTFTNEGSSKTARKTDGYPSKNGVTSPTAVKQGHKSKSPTSPVNRQSDNKISDKNGRVSVVNSTTDESLSAAPIKSTTSSASKEKAVPLKQPPPSQKSAEVPKRSAQNGNGKENGGGDGGNVNNTNSGSNHNKPKVLLPHYMEPSFYIGGGNGVAIVEDVLVNMGWKRTRDKSDDGYRLKWCELKSAINYNTFKEGDQLVNHIPNCNLLTNKLGLLNSLQEYDRMALAYRRKVAKLDFIPETLRLDDPREREVFRNLYQEGDMFICKPTGRNQGKGIFIVKTEEEVKKIFEEQEGRTADGKPVKPLNRIIQRYLHKPLLLNKKKFDLRCYMLVASTVPFLVVYHKGYVRLTIHDYDNDTDNLIAHLTNQFIQKKDPTYKEVKEETTWSMERFNQYINEVVAPEKEGVEQDWVFNTLTTRMKQIMTYCFNAVKHKLACKIGYFDLYGFDFMVDEDMKVWLIEVNVNPCLAINCEALRDVIPGVVKETIHIAVECFEKGRKGRPLMPLQSLKNFEILVNSCPRTGSNSGNSNGQGKTNRSKSMSPAVPRRSITRSPLKEPAVVSASTEVSRNNDNPRYAYQQNRGTTMLGRRAGVNTPRATSTTIPDNSTPQADQPKPTQQRATKSGGTATNSSANQKSEQQAPASNQKAEQRAPAEPIDKNNKSRNNSNGSNNTLKVTTFKMADENKEPTEAKPAKSTDKSPFSTTSIGKSLPVVRQNTEISPKATRQAALPPGTKKLQYKNLRREPTISVRMITKDSANSKLPAETKIVIVDNKSNKEITDSTESLKNSSHSGTVTKDSVHQSGIRRSAYIDSSSGKTKPQNSPQPRRSPQQPAESDPDLKRSTSSKSGRKSVKTTKSTDSTLAEEPETSSNHPKNRVNTPHGGSASSSGGDGLTPMDPSQVKPTSRYAVFPLSPYKQPVAQLKMTHKNKKAKSRGAVEISNRGS